MNQRKILDLSEDVSLVYRNGVLKLISENCNQPDIELNAQELRDWLTKEVLNEPIIKSAMPNLGTSVQEEIKRNPIVRQDGFQVMDLSKDIGKAKEAFSKEHLYDGGSGNR